MKPGEVEKRIQRIQCKTVNYERSEVRPVMHCFLFILNGESLQEG